MSARFALAPSRACAPRQLVEGPRIACKGVNLLAPDGTVLVRDLSFTMEAGTCVMLTGPNGSGKSSLIRVLAELWPVPTGRVTRPPRRELLFLSQVRPEKE